MNETSSTKTLVTKYYSLATDFFEYGWGQSFHFANRYRGETFDESLQRHESYLALRMGLKAGDKVLDIGCGVGGPLRRIAYLSKAHITGITISDYQIQRAKTIGESTCVLAQSKTDRNKRDLDSFMCRRPEKLPFCSR